MLLWKKLYHTVWIAFFSCMLIPFRLGAAGFPVHTLLGLILLFVTLSNGKQLAALPVPDRLKRISKVTAGFAIFQIINGLALGAVLHFVPQLSTARSIIKGIHIVCALAILAQASSVATAYDMWEEKEFDSGTESTKK